MKKIFALSLFTVFSSLLAGFALPPQPALAACNQDARFLTIPAWYRGVTDGNCNVSVETAGGLKPFIWKVALNIVEMMLHIVAYISVAFIIFGGFKYMTSAGDQNGVSGGKKTIMNAVIGLVISIMSIGIVNFVTANLG